MDKKYMLPDLCDFFQAALHNAIRSKMQFMLFNGQVFFISPLCTGDEDENNRIDHVYPVNIPESELFGDNWGEYKHFKD